MELTEFSKIVFGVVTAIGTIALTMFNLSQTRKVTAELLEKFEIAVEKNQKNSVTELFRLIHGLRMNYSDILKLINHDDCSKIIYALKKTPGLVCYQNGTFQYTNFGKNSLFRFIDKWFNRFGIAVFSLITIFIYVLLVLSSGINTLIFMVLLMLFSFLLGRQLKQKRHDQMVETLVNTEYNK